MHVTVKVAIFVSMLSLANSVQNDKATASSAMDVVSSEIVSRVGNAECDLILLPGDKDQECQTCDSEIDAETLNILQQVLCLYYYNFSRMIFN